MSSLITLTLWAKDECECDPGTEIGPKIPAPAPANEELRREENGSEKRLQNGGEW